MVREKGETYRFIRHDCSGFQNFVIRTVEIWMLVHLEPETVAKPMCEVWPVISIRYHLPVSKIY